MKSKSKNIIKTLLLSATVALFHGTAKADAKKVFALDLDLGLGNGGATPEVSKGKQPLVKNVYKILRNGDAKLIAGHRSHSSHRYSRGGHYSHSSSIIRILQARMEAVAVHRFIHLLLKQLAIIHLATGHCPRGFMAPT